MPGVSLKTSAVSFETFFNSPMVLIPTLVSIFTLVTQVYAQYASRMPAVAPLALRSPYLHVWSSTSGSATARGIVGQAAKRWSGSVGAKFLQPSQTNQCCSECGLDRPCSRRHRDLQLARSSRGHSSRYCHRVSANSHPNHLHLPSRWSPVQRHFFQSGRGLSVQRNANYTLML